MSLFRCVPVASISAKGGCTWPTAIAIPGPLPDFAAVLAALADEYQANNERGRRSLIARCRGLFPGMRGGGAGRELRRLARRWCRALLERECRPPFSARASRRSHSRWRRKDGEVLVLRTAEGIVVNWAVKGADGGWLLACDHAARDPVAFPEDAVILGRVVWTVRAFV